MDKIYILIVLLLVQTNIVFAHDIDMCVNYKKALNLSESKIQKINNIEKEYNSQIAKLNAQILLKKMQILQGSPKADILNSELKSLSREFDEIERDREREILSNLSFIQRYKYKKYCGL